MGDGELDGKNAIATMKKIKKLRKIQKKIWFCAKLRQFQWMKITTMSNLLTFGHKYLDSNSVICDFVKDPKYFPKQNDKVITMSRYLGSTVWKWHNNTDFAQKAIQTKRWRYWKCKKISIFRRIQTEAKRLCNQYIK